MPDVSSEIARRQSMARTDAIGPSVDRQIADMGGKVARLMNEVEGLVSRKDSSLSPEIMQAIKDAVKECMQAEKPDTDQPSDPEEPAADAAGPGTPPDFDREPSGEDRHHRADARQARADAIDDGNRLGEFQARADRVAQMHGKSIERPRLGDSYASYRARTLNSLARHCLPSGHQLQGADLRLNRDEAQLEAMKDRILADGEKAAYDPTHNTNGYLREVRRKDQAGRDIIEFVGDVGVTLAPFRMPKMQARGLQESVRHYQQLDALRNRG